MHREFLKQIKETEGEEGLEKFAEQMCEGKTEKVPETLNLLNALISGTSLLEMEGLPKELCELLYQNALNQYKNGLYVPSGKIFNLLHFIDSDNFDYAFARACAVHQQKKYDAAVMYYSTASSLEPTNPKPYYHMADCWERMNKPFSAYQALIAAYKLAIGKHNEKGNNPFAENIYREMQRLEKKMGITDEFKEKAEKKSEEFFAKLKDIEEGKMDSKDLAILLLQYRAEVDKEIEANMQRKATVSG